MYRNIWMYAVISAIGCFLMLSAAPAMAQCDPPGQNTKCWDNGDGDGLWGTDLNWDPNGVPESSDDVYHLIGGTIAMNAGTYDTPTQINSLTVNGDNGGSLDIQQGKGLNVAGDFSIDTGDPEALVYTVTLDADSYLEVGGTFREVNAWLQEDVVPGNPTTLIGHDLDGGQRAGWILDAGTELHFDGDLRAGTLLLTDAVIGRFGVAGRYIEGGAIYNTHVTALGASAIKARIIGAGDWVVDSQAVVQCAEINTGAGNPPEGGESSPMSDWTIQGEVKVDAAWDPLQVGNGGVSWIGSCVVDGGILIPS